MIDSNARANAMANTTQNVSTPRLKNIPPTMMIAVATTPTMAATEPLT